jgi:hypothetical protein
MTRLWAEQPGSIFGMDKRFFSSPQHPDWLWSPPSLLSNGYWGLYPQEESSRGVKLTTNLHLVLRSRMVEVNLHSLICLHGIVLNYIIKNRDNFTYTFTLTHILPKIINIITMCTSPETILPHT